MTELTVNGQTRRVDADADTPLLWALREDLGLPGTKFGCGVGLCGACTVHLDGEAVRSCQVPVSEVGARKVTTIEAIGEGGLDTVQQAWVAEQVPQCGYCQSGMVMAATALLKANPHPSVAEIRAAITNICRCGTYPRIVAAIARAVTYGSKVQGAG